MAGVRDIRRRIRSVANMQQITKAMKMVAAAKLRKSQEKVIASRPYAKQLQSVLARLVQNQAEARHPLLEKRPVEKVGYILVTSDRGLCGGFNTNLNRMTRSLLDEKTDVQAGLVAVGRKGIDFFTRRNIEIITQFTGLGDSPNYSQAKGIAKDVIGLYTRGELDEVYLVYSKFISVLSQEPTAIKLLPIEPSAEKASGSYIFEPEPQQMLDKLLPSYVESQIFSALLESKASEMGAKMTAMDSATENAKEMIGKLTLMMNRARQAAITKEISEIVGGAAALE
ncbi:MULTISPECIES: ATP synthase F1 subunit gamma [Dehalobacter]|uniref:ATP synthase gamma chain n=2 Tax=Dehalobacter restrictus TaxID=55583 RepID=A0A857DMZ6_9FIRM|nr:MULTISPECIES: ATP synthase F1 subunit gamma [Dehalobacter]AHF11079.1 F0F1 ATP synthase subunit gamma [Dehalobacter restrictus DSM 9455]MCG1024662.1 F0F1 ATP synthase subunit gamma [Dehalobacter sp.]MDJ0305224.1 ATP synthase F1 subunit gamma [Dehalobacter sp.]OCZ53943.1 F0F1 ATP synthase subunit gamma [Dehalobacter sp. TeCB1]QHA01729.1 F0F1 ATP synthase subunit gamma [Dehalobacter restrictus]